MVRYLNTRVYTHWMNGSDVLKFEKIVEFVQHKRSLSRSTLNQATQYHDKCPTYKTLAKAITTLQNNTKQGPMLEEIQRAKKVVEQQLEAKIAKIGLDINKHTMQTSRQCNISTTKNFVQKLDTAATTYIYHQDYLLEQLKLLAIVLEEDN